MEAIRRMTANYLSGSVIRAEIANLPPAVLCLLPALALGAALPFVTALPASWAILVCLTICGGFAALAMFSVNLPLEPVLRLLLLESFWFSMDINLFPVSKNRAEPPGLNISLMLILSFVLCGFWLLKQRRGNEGEPALPRSFALTLIGILLWSSLTVMYGTETTLGLYGLWAAAGSMFMCFVITAHFSERRVLRQTLIYIALIIGLNSLFGVSQALFPSLSDITLSSDAPEKMVIVSGEEVTRVHALSDPPNMFAWVLVLFLPVVIAPLLLCAAKFRRWQQALFASAIGMAVVALILTYSRGAWVAFAVMAPLMAVAAVFILKGDDRKRLIYRFGAVALMVGLLAIPFSGKIISRLVDDDRGAAEVRIPLIEVALAMIADNPVLGVGMGSYESVMRNYDETEGLVTEHFDWPVHNIYLHIAAETGLPGLALFLALIVIAARRGWMVLREPAADPLLRALALGLLTGMAAYLINGLKEGSCFQTAMMRPFFLFCGLLLATERASRRAAG